MSAAFDAVEPERRRAGAAYATHEVLNQAGALEDYDAYARDRPLAEAVEAFGGAFASDVLSRAGEVVGSAKVQDLARRANRSLPELRTHDRFGQRIDVVEFHPAYHELMRAHLRLRSAFLRLDATRARAPMSRGPR